MLAERAPTIWFEQDDFVSLPVDYRECRARSCADTISHGSLQHTQTGLQPTVFTHVIDCRDPDAAAAEGYDCSGERAGNVYLQYWLYYPDSLTHGLGRVGGYHQDDWESYQVKVDPETGATLARASSHHSYNGREGGDIGTDIGRPRAPAGTRSSASFTSPPAATPACPQAGADDDRRIEPGNFRLVPLEPIAKRGDAPSFEVSPPWDKGVWGDPESMGT